MARNRTRAVVAFDKLTGDVLGRWDCPGEASRDLGVSESSIVSQARLRAVPQGWTAFRFEGERLLEPQEGYDGRRCRPVLCTDGRRVVAFRSLVEAGTAIGGSGEMIKSHCDNGKPVLFGGVDVVFWLPQTPSRALSGASKWRAPERKLGNNRRSDQRCHFDTVN